MTDGPLTLAELRTLATPWGAELRGNPRQVCTHVTQDSRRARQGALFAVVSGGGQNGAAFVASALQAGAQSLLLERGSATEVLAQFPNVPALIVDDLAAVLGPLSHAALGYPATKVAITGITGTNGKTTIVGLVRQCFERLGRNAASLGTLGYCHQGRTVDFGMTTPNADLVAEFLHQAHIDGVDELAMEVSSHALALGRVDGLTFEVGGYINLTQDHLDFHGTFAEYASAKRRLFEASRSKRAVIHTDDVNLAALAREIAPAWGDRLVTVGHTPNVALRLLSSRLGLHETQFCVAWRGAELAFRTKLLGEHNVANWLVALGVLAARGVALTELQELLPDVEPAPGRLQRCDSPKDDLCVLVDYAHTPDALERALIASRALQPNAVWCVFGCGGDRDRSKRPIMGEISARLADVVVITNDNPRTENAEDIAAEIRAGATGGDVRLILDRARAIEAAVQAAAPGDLVLIAGKGHESYQIFGKTKVHFDDREVATEALNRRRQRSSNPAN